MKHGSAIIMMIIAMVVLLGAYGVGLGVKKMRIERAESAVAVADAPEGDVKVTARDAQPGGGMDSEPSREQRVRGQDERARRGEQWENMTEEQRREFLASRGGRGGGDSRRRPGGGEGRRPGGQTFSEEDRRAMMERFQNMSEEERAEYREQMRSRFGGGGRSGGGGFRRSGGDGESRGPGGGFSEMSPAERERRRAEAEATRMKANQENPPEN